jgi:hypothetical protein
MNAHLIEVQKQVNLITPLINMYVAQGLIKGENIANDVERIKEDRAARNKTTEPRIISVVDEIITGSCSDPDVQDFRYEIMEQAMYRIEERRRDMAEQDRRLRTLEFYENISNIFLVSGIIGILAIISILIIFFKLLVG